MKKLFLLIPLLFLGCKTIKTVYVPIEKVRIERQTVHDTIIDVKLDVLRDSIVTKDTISILSNKYAISSAKWSNNTLYHSLSTKDIHIPVKIQYVNTYISDTIQVPYKVEVLKEVNILTAWQIIRIKIFNLMIIIIGGYFLIRYRKNIIGIISKLL